MKESILYTKLPENKVQCNLCSHRCIINNSKKGTCSVRENQEGLLYSLNYGKLAAQHIDPIEKKPLFHFYPGSSSYSIATAGCNFKCIFCQNFDLSQMPERMNRITGQHVEPDEVVEQAVRHNCKSISYTYTEPAIYLDYALEVAKKAHQFNITNVFVTNGYFTPESLTEISPYLDAANVDLKSFSDDFYKKLCSAKLQPVLDSIKLLKDSDIWIEITTLIIPSRNDSNQEIHSIAEFIAGVDKDIPWHISAFYPTYKLVEIPPTPAKALMNARQIGINAGLRYVYTGNIFSKDTETTYCYNCGEILIERHAYDIVNKLDSNSSCPSCGTVITGRGLERK